MSGKQFSCIVLVLFALLSSCGRNESVPSPSVAEIGTPAPDFSLLSVSGETVKLSGLKGRVVLLEFWATWCGPCKESIPELSALYGEYRDRGFTVIGVSVDGEGNPTKELAAFARDNRMNYPVLAGTEETSRTYGVRSIPAGFLIDKEGRIVETFVGYSGQFKTTIRAKIEKLL